MIDQLGLASKGEAEAPTLLRVPSTLSVRAVSKEKPGQVSKVA